MKVHVIGLGMSGLSAGVYLSSLGISVIGYESTRFAGGRCRSFHDKRLDCVIDNGNHLILSGNRSLGSYIDRIGSRDRFEILPARFSFIDVRDGKRWQIRPNRGYIPWWIFSRTRRPHCVGAYELCRLGRFLRVRGDLSVGDYLRGSSSLSREYFWDPLVISLLNTPTQTAGASLLSPIIREIFLPGSSACHPLLAPDGLSSALVDPGLDYLSRHGGVFHFHSRLLGFSDDGGRVTCLHFNNKDVSVSHDDGIILCLPPHIISSFFPDMDVPRGGNVILNVHYRYTDQEALFPGDGFIGVIGGTAHWFFVRGGIVSATVSAASDYDRYDNEDIAHLIWNDAIRVFDLDTGTLPPFRVIRERRATYIQTAREILRRPPINTRYSNVFLAGDWVNTGLPATIESAVRSGILSSRAFLGAHN